MHGTLLAAGLTALLQGAPAGPDSAAVMAVVHRFVDAFNQGDTTTAIATCAKKTSMTRTPGRTRSPMRSSPWARRGMWTSR